MIYSIQQKLTLSVPITLAGHRQAQLFYQHHADPDKAKQVYLNTLAVEAVRTYLGWLGLATDLEAGDSWDPLMQTLMDVADLALPKQHKLECRPVLPGATSCDIPPETNGDRIGYLPVLFDAALESATLLGFVPSAEISAETQAVPLTDLRPVESLFQYLELPPSPIEEPNSVEKRVSLGAWLEGTIASGWQTVEDLLGPQPAFNFRSLELSKPLKTPKSAVSGKLLELAPSTQVVLLVGILQSDALHFDIWVKLCPRGDGSPSEWPSHCVLPENLEVRVLDGRDTVVMEAQSRQTDMLQLNFRGVLNEQFSVEVCLNGVSLVGKFVI